MSVEQAYLKFKQKVEKYITNDSISTSRGNFVLLFNESQNKFLEAHLQQRGIDDVRYIQNFLVLDKKISHTSKLQDHYNFSLPIDLADVRAIASTSNCSNEILNLFEIQTENLNAILQDEFNKPSFKWREAPYTVNSNSLSVYTDNDFKVDEILLNYYRYPNPIKLISPTNPESLFNESSKIEWDEKSLDRIISISAGEFGMNEGSTMYQLQNLRTQK